MFFGKYSNLSFPFSLKQSVPAINNTLSVTPLWSIWKTVSELEGRLWLWLSAGPLGSLMRWLFRQLEVKLSGILRVVALCRKPDALEMVSSWFWERMLLLKETKLPARKFREEQPRFWLTCRDLGQPHRRGRICSARVISKPSWQAVCYLALLKHWS